ARYGPSDVSYGRTTRSDARSPANRLRSASPLLFGGMKVTDLGGGGDDRVSGLRQGAMTRPAPARAAIAAAAAAQAIDRRRVTAATEAGDPAGRSSETASS